MRDPFCQSVHRSRREMMAQIRAEDYRRAVRDDAASVKLYTEKAKKEAK